MACRALSTGDTPEVLDVLDARDVGVASLRLKPGISPADEVGVVSVPDKSTSRGVELPLIVSGSSMRGASAGEAAKLVMLLSK
jgi:hypothetical protein